MAFYKWKLTVLLGWEGSICVSKQAMYFIKSACVYTVGDKNTETRHLTQLTVIQWRGCRSWMAYLFTVTGKTVLFCVQISFAYWFCF
jgi:hypothetical protein